MGFADKMKSIGGKALGAVACAATRSYGTVTKGQYSGCKLALDSHQQKLVFIKLTDVVAQPVIKDEVQTFCFTLASNDAETYEIVITFNNGETSTVHMTTDKNIGSNLPTPEQRIAARYADIGTLMTALATKVPVTDETRGIVNTLLRFAGMKEIG